MTFFALLSVFMVVVSYLFVIGLAAACVYLPYLIVSNSESPGAQVIVLFVFGIVIAAAMLWSLLPRFDKFKAPGLLLERSSQPRLFAELENIAAALNQPMPREVYLIGDVNAWVADRGGFMGIGSRRVMGLGLPLLSILTISQFRAVLAHEFAHYYGGDTRMGPWVYKTQSAIVRIFQNIGSVGKLARIAILGVMYLVVATLMKWYFMVFLRAINLASRKRELRADELACLIAGRQPLIEGLRTIHGASMAWPVYWKTEISPVVSEGALPGIGEGFARFVSVPNIHDQLRKGIEKEIQEAKTNPYDSHPPLRDRIAAAEKMNENLVAEDSTPARTLLDHADAVELSFLEGANPDLKRGSIQWIRWEELGSKVTVPHWKQVTREYASVLQDVTAGTIPEQIPKLPAIGASMRDPKGMLLGPEQRRARAGHLLGMGLALALLDQGWELDVSPGVFDLRKGGESFNPFRMIEQLMEGKILIPAWKARCEELGISELPIGMAADAAVQS